MFTRLLGTAATAYGVLAALTALLQARQMLARHSSREISARFLASYAGGYAIWLAYGLSAGSLPLIVVDTTGLLCGGLTLTVALSLRGSLIRPGNWNGAIMVCSGVGGHDVTAVARNRGKLSSTVRAVTTDLTAPNEAALESAVTGVRRASQAADRRRRCCGAFASSRPPRGSRVPAEGRRAAEGPDAK